MITSLPPITVTAFVFGVIGLIFLSLVAQLLRDKQHKYLVILTSLLIISLIDTVSTLILILFANISYFVIVSGGSRKVIQVTAWLGIAVLMGYKALQSMNSHTDFFILIGVSYYTFRIASVLFDVARSRINPPAYIDFMVYCSFFPIFAGGPIQRLHSFSRNNTPIDSNILWGLFLIARALIKKVLIADIIILFLISWVESQLTGDAAFSPGAGEDALAWKSTVTLPLGFGVILYGFLNILRAYFDLSSFTDLALGLARLFGYDIDKNFNRPFLARNIIDFWRRWHLTIAGWAKDYVFSPLMLSTRNLAVAVFLTMIAMGLWHELSARWLFWGVCHGFGLIACGWWQRTGLSLRLIRLESSCKICLSKVLVDENNSSCGVFSRFLRTKIAFVLEGFITTIFFFPGWVLTFGYMSLVFVAVSRPSMTSALEFYMLLF